MTARNPFDFVLQMLWYQELGLVIWPNPRSHQNSTQAINTSQYLPTCRPASCLLSPRPVCGISTAPTSRALLLKTSHEAVIRLCCRGGFG